MKRVEKLTTWRIVSEPGDGTRYEYIVTRNYNGYIFASFNGLIKYPDRIESWMLSDKDEDIMRLANEFKCNPWTLKECFRTVSEIEASGEPIGEKE